MSRHLGDFKLMISEQQFIQLLQKRSQGACTEDEISLIDKYLELKHTVESNDRLPDALILSTYDKISVAIDTHNQQQQKRRRVLHATIRIAASIILISSVSFLFYQRKEVINNYINPLTYTNITAKSGKNISVTLPDGSVVLLNQNSKLTYSNRFNEHLREVSLIGEAYFQVAKNKHKPFIVHAGKLNTRVLGTSFNIEAYPFSKEVAVELITGKIWLTDESPKKHKVNYILLPNQAVTYNAVTGLAERKDVMNADNYTAWKDGRIRFSNAPMNEVVRRLNITFRSRIILADNVLAGQTIYGEFGLNEQPAAIVKAICMLIKAKYIIKPDGGIIISSTR